MMDPSSLRRIRTILQEFDESSSDEDDYENNDSNRIAELSRIRRPDLKVLLRCIDVDMNNIIMASEHRSLDDLARSPYVFLMRSMRGPQQLWWDFLVVKLIFGEAISMHLLILIPDEVGDNTYYLDFIEKLDLYMMHYYMRALEYNGGEYPEVSDNHQTDVQYVKDYFSTAGFHSRDFAGFELDPATKKRVADHRIDVDAARRATLPIYKRYRSRYHNTEEGRLIIEELKQVQSTMDDNQTFKIILRYFIGLFNN